MMDRRHFSKTLAGALGASVLPPSILLAREPGINGPRLNAWLKELSRFGERDDGGVDRVAFSDADIEGRAYVRSLMEEGGLAVRMDAGG